MVFVNIGHGGWYPLGSVRLMEQLQNEVTCIKPYLPQDYPSQQKYPYMAKSRFIVDMFNTFANSYDISWVDCSVIFQKPVSEYKEMILNSEMFKKTGFWAYATGETIGQTCNDKAFRLSGLDESFLQLPELATTVFTIHNKDIIKNFKYLIDKGGLIGKRENGKSESKRKEFKYHRQDQTCMTLAYYMTLGTYFLDFPKLGEISQYAYPNEIPNSEKYYLLIKGGL